MPSRRKSEEEARVERLTWGAMVAVIMVLVGLPNASGLPPVIAPAACAAILLGSGIYQASKRWSVHPVTWMMATVLLLLAGGVVIRPALAQTFPVLSITLAALVVVILLGIFTGDT
jgi:hypothetical protein